MPPGGGVLPPLLLLPPGGEVLFLLVLSPPRRSLANSEPRSAALAFTAGCFFSSGAAASAPVATGSSSSSASSSTGGGVSGLATIPAGVERRGDTSGSSLSLNGFRSNRRRDAPPKKSETDADGASAFGEGDDEAAATTLWAEVGGSGGGENGLRVSGLGSPSDSE